MGQADSVAIGIYLWKQEDGASETVKLIPAYVHVTMNKSFGLSEPQSSHL